MWGWIGVAVVVASYDAYAVLTKRRETMSSYARRHPDIVITGVAVFLRHLLVKGRGRV